MSLIFLPSDFKILFPELAAAGEWGQLIFVGTDPPIMTSADRKQATTPR
jgi:hypothetical protein